MDNAAGNFRSGESVRQLISEEQIRLRIAHLSREIRQRYVQKNLVIVSVLKGSFVFVADLMREIGFANVEIHFIGLASYGRGRTESKGEVEITYDLNRPLKDCDVLVVEDIVDTGNTMEYLLKLLRLREPESLAVCTLLSKPSRRQVEVKIDFLGFEIEDRFVVGYGLDYDEAYRGLKYIGELKFTESG